ncbi:MAG TPA: thioesterase family protein [Stellaceae bacterium]|nr:thioesterase family protein [Stellaceae bacterium]
MTFPYPLPSLDLAAPFDRHRSVVRPEWADPNGHMNLAYYMLAFDHASDDFSVQLGVGWDYVEHKLGMAFILEAHITYDREVRAGDPLRITTQILDHDEKRVHFFHRMYHGEAGWLASTNELIMMHIDFESRRASPWPEESLRRLDAMAEAHRPLPRPEQAGRVIGIRRKGQGS